MKYKSAFINLAGSGQRTKCTSYFMGKELIMQQWQKEIQLLLCAGDVEKCRDKI